jgi:hypothetical protein
MHSMHWCRSAERSLHLGRRALTSGSPIPSLRRGRLERAAAARDTGANSASCNSEEKELCCWLPAQEGEIRTPNYCLMFRRHRFSAHHLDERREPERSKTEPNLWRTTSLQHGCFFSEPNSAPNSVENSAHRSLKGLGGSNPPLSATESLSLGSFRASR